MKPRPAPDEVRVSRLAERWPIGTLVRHSSTGKRAVVWPVGDELAARWNDGRAGHVALLRYRHRPELGGLLYVQWEHGDSCWTRIDVLELVDAVGMYRIWEERFGDAPVYRLGLHAGEPHWFGGTNLSGAGPWAQRGQVAFDEVLAVAA